jgi:hypothetical protein
MTDQQNEWKLDFEDDKNVFYTVEIMPLHTKTEKIPKSLLDQIRRVAKEEQAQIDVEEYQNLLQKKKSEARLEAKKDLLDAIEKEEPSVLWNAYKDRWIRFKAKTLGEKPNVIK